MRYIDTGVCEICGHICVLIWKTGDDGSTIISEDRCFCGNILSINTHELENRLAVWNEVEV
jgi:hypothetical protein